MKKKILALCNTPYQIIVASKLEQDYYTDDFVDIIVTDYMNESLEIFNGLKASRIYRRVHHWKVKESIKNDKLSLIKTKLLGKKVLRRFLPQYDELDKRYDVFLFANNSMLVQYLGSLLRMDNSNLFGCMYEDGLSTYSDYYGQFWKRKNWIHRWLRSFFFTISTVYLFNPNILDWTPNCEIVKVDPTFCRRLINDLNLIFRYRESIDKYDKKYIFFEESYSGDGRPIDDCELVDKIAQLVGKNNIYVKVHPRNKKNRFNERGYKTNIDTRIPWEIILLNNDFTNTIFISIASSATINPFLFLGKNIKTILLYRCTKYPESLYKEIVKLCDKICSINNEVFVIPNRISELKSLLDKPLI
ncbi:polysialyltransferase family glycosyltransferase [Sporolactobacillus spathodeae]|uniref:Glycosyltransferase family 52 n=1 Tax=Sporolactobacillus spathodeae TaxID=1465502 RepID=A0ABS2Q7I5_9BACL|nr:polysialyltransferase family glycosyltransferase [Sporolactobacillus spathodeae]MBM7657752.1 hypothetical protein [Sporolactobacillus spathodeae]